MFTISFSSSKLSGLSAFIGTVVQSGCRDRYLWIHVASGQTPRFEAVGQFFMFTKYKLIVLHQNKVVYLPSHHRLDNR